MQTVLTGLTGLEQLRLITVRRRLRTNHHRADEGGSDLEGLGLQLLSAASQVLGRTSPLPLSVFQPVTRCCSTHSCAAANGC